MSTDKTFVVAIGSPVDGLTFVGPYPVLEQAMTWAENNLRARDWWVVSVYPESRF